MSANVYTKYIIATLFVHNLIVNYKQIAAKCVKNILAILSFTAERGVVL